MSNNDSAVMEQPIVENKVPERALRKDSADPNLRYAECKSKGVAPDQTPACAAAPSMDYALLHGLVKTKKQTEVTSKSLAGPSELLMAMPLRKGFVDCLDTLTYKSRAKTVAELFSKLRASSRESSLSQPFPDMVGRLRTIYSTHIAVLEPDQLLLSVTFDRPWEPYIRLVWRDLSALLDPILCNCEGYAGVHSSDQGLVQFARWIRKYQINTSNYYLLGNHTVDDILYLDQIEKIYRGNACPAEADRLVAAHRVRGPEQLAQDQRPTPDDPEYLEFIKLGVKAITAFHALTHIYPTQSDDHRYLYHAARTALEDFPASNNWLPSNKDWQPPTKELVSSVAAIRQLFHTEIQWFEHGARDISDAPKTNEQIKSLPGPLEFLQSLQGGILEGYDANVGCLLLLRITNPTQARAFIDRFRKQVTTAANNPAGNDDLYRNIAFTPSGLVNLGVSAADIDTFPKEFRDGMESRAGLLGDIQTNHPDRWCLPERNWPPSSNEGDDASIERVSLDCVDIVIQLRAKKSGVISHVWSKEHVLLSAIEDLDEEARGGLTLLAVQPMYAREDKKEHFGFKDGLSQPFVAPKENRCPRDKVNAGEVFLGYVNDHEDPPQHNESALLNNGTFLVIRSLAQHVPLLEDVVKQQSENLKGHWSAAHIMAKIMGRTLEGVPLVDTASQTDHNDFDYRDDPKGEQCPLHAHIRRTQPRDGSDDDNNNKKVPRIIRRGMSYGPARDEAEAADRGVIFQAYNASIAEQFEVIQRWVSGGNSTGTYSRQNDALLGVPLPGEDRILAFPRDGDEPVRLNLGQKPFVTLNWGCYLFVPSMEALQKLSAIQEYYEDNDAERGEDIIARLQDLAKDNETEAAAAWKQLLEERDSLDEGEHHAVWCAIRKNHNGVLRTPFGVLVGKAGLVDQVLKDPARFVVDDYNTRLKRCIGKNYLGFNPPRHDEEAEIPNRVLAAVTDEEAFAVAYKIAKEALQALDEIDGNLNIPLPKYADLVLSAIAKHWFGVPDGPAISDPPTASTDSPEDRAKALKQAIASASVLAGGQPAQGAQTSHCPYHFTSPSRYVFQPGPSAEVEKIAIIEGDRLQQNVRSYVRKQRNVELMGLAGILNEQLPDTVSDESFASVLLGALLGFMPTVQGNFLTTMREWIRSRDLWRIQQTYLDELPEDESGANMADSEGETKPEPDPARAWPAAKTHLLPYLKRSMAARPVPAMIHRKAAAPTELGGEHLQAGEQLVLGLVSAAADHNFDEIWPVFGGDYWEQSSKATHACPAQQMALGTLLGMMAAFFELPGTLRPTPSSLGLTLQGERVAPMTS